eukprot:432029-Prymnesium_polylepis.1
MDEDGTTALAQRGQERRHWEHKVQALLAEARAQHVVAAMAPTTHGALRREAATACHTKPALVARGLAATRAGIYKWLVEVHAHGHIEDAQVAAWHDEEQVARTVEQTPGSQLTFGCDAHLLWQKLPRRGGLGCTQVQLERCAHALRLSRRLHGPRHSHPPRPRRRKGAAAADGGVGLVLEGERRVRTSAAAAVQGEEHVHAVSRRLQWPDDLRVVRARCPMLQRDLLVAAAPAMDFASQEQPERGRRPLLASAVASGL